MPPTIQQIKEQLLKAIDEDANVVDLAGVVEVITTLEKYPVTKEALEETRLGKLVNEIRRKTNNDDLSKRCRKLVKLWQNLCIPQTPNANRLPRSASAAALNGSSLATSTPKTSLAKGNKTPDVRPSTSQALGKTYIADRKKRRAAECSSNSPDAGPAEKKIALSSSPRLHTSYSDSDLVNGLPSGSEPCDAQTLAIRSNIKPRTSTPTLPGSSQASSSKCIQSPRLQSLHSKPRTPVLQSKVHKSNKASDVKSKSHTTSTSPSRGHLLESSTVGTCKDLSHQDFDSIASDVKAHVIPIQKSKLDSIHIHSETHSLKNIAEDSTSNVDERAEVVRETIEQTVKAPPPKPVTCEDVERIHCEHWEGVNGCSDNQGQWHDWSECLEINTSDDNVLHILPYVILD